MIAKERNHVTPVATLHTSCLFYFFFRKYLTRFLKNHLICLHRLQNISCINFKLQRWLVSPRKNKIEANISKLCNEDTLFRTLVNDMILMSRPCITALRKTKNDRRRVSQVLYNRRYYLISPFSCLQIKFNKWEYFCSFFKIEKLCRMMLLTFSFAWRYEIGLSHLFKIRSKVILLVHHANSF